MYQALALQEVSGIQHGFFTRQGGNSTGPYASLNTGLGSNDDRTTVLTNREHVRNALGATSLVTPYQHHSADVVTLSKPWPVDQPPKADGVVTTTPGVAIAINTADCTPVLFADNTGQIIGAAHAGWQGALSGVLEATVEAMCKLGAELGNIHAAIGPTISKVNYEVGPEFYDRFVAAALSNSQFFLPAMRHDHYMFDLPGFVRTRLASLSLAAVEDLGKCTYAGETEFFSYRRTTHHSEPDYGRQMSAIVINS